MRLVVWHSDRYPTAPGVYLGCFPGMGHEVTWVVSDTGERNEIVERRERGVRHFEIRRRQDSLLPSPLGTVVNRWNKLITFVLKARLMDRLARERPDVLQVRDLVTEGLLGLWAARRHGVRFAYQLDHPHFEARLMELDLGERGRVFERLWMRLWIGLRRRVLRGADLVFPISLGMGELLRDHEGVDPRRMVVFPVGISRATFEQGGAGPVDARVAALRGQATVCYLGSLATRRDPGLIFGVLEEVGRLVPESRFLVVGEMTTAIRELLPATVEGRLHFIPFVPHDEVPALLRAARVGIFPIALDDPHGVYRTSSPLKVVEYLSAGLPVVASRVRDAEEALGESGGGVCVENDPVVFARAVESYLRDPELARREGARGRAWIETHRLFDVLARDVEAAYRRLLEGSVPAGAESPLSRESGPSPGAMGDVRPGGGGPAVSSLAGDLVPLALPHYRLRKDELYFLISRRPVARLDAREQDIWKALDGAARVQDLLARYPASAEPALRRFLELGVCLLVEERFPAGRRRVLVLEPHMDDAALSLGGVLWSRRAECEFTVVSLAGRGNFTSYYSLERDYFDVDEVSELRRAESVLFARAVGGCHVALDLPEAPLRYHPVPWTLDWFRRHRGSIAAFISHSSSPEERGTWTERIRQVLRDIPADEVWAPIGVGPHTDHELVRNAFLTILLEDPGLLSRCEVRFYQEVPYAAQFPHFTSAIVEELTRSGARLELETVPVTEVFPDKLRLISVFGSQFKLEVLRPGIEAAARAAGAGGGGMAEILYRVATPPERLDFLALSVGAPEVRRLAEELGPWIERHRHARRIRLFVRPPAGRWAEDMRWLLDTFPAARFSVRASREALAEATDVRSPRIEVGSIGKGPAAWALGVLSANLEGPAPTLILAFVDRMREARRLSILLPLSDTLVVPSMNHLVLALRLLAGAGSPQGASETLDGSAGT